MRVAIIGGGWLGCHIASKLKQENHTVKLFEKTDIFSGSSFYNQNRLHKGFHYSRNQKTRKLCYDTFELFNKEYWHLVDDVPNNYYVVPMHTSLLDFETFKNIYKYERIPFRENTLDAFTNIEGSIVVDEKYINPNKAREHFKSILQDDVIKQDITDSGLDVLSEQNDLVVNVTNNVLKPLPEHYYELSLTLVYTKYCKSPFGSITMVDGPLFSIYPLRDMDYTVTDVQYTPMFRSSNLQDIYTYRDAVDINTVEVLKRSIELKILRYYPDFASHFKFKTYYTSIKVRRISESADRSPTIERNGNIVTCVTGKIQGIYTLENYIRNEYINR